MFIIVIIHELGHVAAAREVGWDVTEIQLLPFGGVAIMNENGTTGPLEEVIIALAGPFMNILMIGASLIFEWGGIWTEEWSGFFMQSNMMIALFNLLPVWPLDGGRILQALLTARFPYRQAVLTSISISFFMALFMLGIGLKWFHPNLIAVSLYLSFVNGQAYRRFPFQFIRFLMERQRRTPDKTRVEPISISSVQTIWEAVHMMQKGKYHLFFVRGKQGGVLTEEDLLDACLFGRNPHDGIGRLL